MAAEATALHKLLLADLASNEYTLTNVNMTVGHIYKYLRNKHMNSLDNKWKKYVEDQLSLGGGKLSQFISKMDKAYLNVSFDTHSKSDDPEHSLKEQKSNWHEFWNPNDDTL